MDEQSKERFKALVAEHDRRCTAEPEDGRICCILDDMVRKWLNDAAADDYERKEREAIVAEANEAENFVPFPEAEVKDKQ